MTQPAPARAVFSSEDFRLLRTAVVHYVRTSDDPEGSKYAHLLHRLGRFGPSRQGR